MVDTGTRRAGIEVKFSSAPSVGKGFWLALDDLGIQQADVVAPVMQGYPLAADVNVVQIVELNLGG